VIRVIQFKIVMAGIDPAIHVLRLKTWMPVSGTGMTAWLPLRDCAPEKNLTCAPQHDIDLASLQGDDVRSGRVMGLKDLRPYRALG
jgi:hypothetical protein